MLVAVEEAADVTIGGVVLPDSAKERPLRCVRCVCVFIVCSYMFVCVVCVCVVQGCCLQLDLVC